MKYISNYLLTIILISFFQCNFQSDKPRVIITTDINNAGGDPDDKQSLVHLLWYADELDIVGIIPDYWNGKGYEASIEVLDTYRKDFEAYNFGTKGYPEPESLYSRLAKDPETAKNMIIREAGKSNESLYILIWGNMTTFKQVLFQAPEISGKVRIMTIGTGVKYGPVDEQLGEECNVVHWTGQGRTDIYMDTRFDKLWWLESNWTYNGMFMGVGPRIMFEKLSAYGSMGKFIKTATMGHDWAQYFRVGDTPSVLYLIDPDNDIEDPERGSWAGKFKKPFPDKRPSYWTDDNGDIFWDYSDPCNSWENAAEMYAYNKNTLFVRRQKMYDELARKLDQLYK